MLTNDDGGEERPEIRVDLAADAIDLAGVVISMRRTAGQADGAGRSAACHSSPSSRGRRGSCAAWHSAGRPARRYVN